MRAARRRAERGLAPGSVLKDRYRLEKKLGEGGMAEVFQAEDTETGRRIAIKILHADVAANKEAVERTKREGQVLSELDNPAIVSVESYGELPDGAVFLVMELLEGETLGARMRRGSSEPAELAPIVAGTCAGLHAAHAKGIIHRDLKPDNIFLCPTDHGLQVKLLDFGISKVYGGERLTQTGEVLGTPRYMSPEQLGAEPDIDGRVDVYALGVILYEALAGVPPFVGTTPTDLIVSILNGSVVPLSAAKPDTPAAVETVVMRAFSRVRTARFDTAMRFAEAYIDAVGGVSAVRKQQKRGLPTRAFGKIKPATDGIVVPDVMPETRPPPAAAKVDFSAAGLDEGTFGGIEAPAKVPLSKETTAMGAVHAAHVPEAPGAPVPQEPTDELLPETANPEEAPKKRRRRVVPETRVGVDLEEPPVSSVRAAEPPRRSVPPTSLMELSQAALRAPRVPAEASAIVAAAGVSGDIPHTPVAGSGAKPVPETRPRKKIEPPKKKVAPREPKSMGRFLKVVLVVSALLAGAASAGAVIAALNAYGETGDGDEHEPHVDAHQDRSSTEEAPLPHEPTETEETDLPSGVEPPDPEPEEAEPTPRTRPARPSKRTHVRPPRETPETPPSGAAVALREARRALGAGDPERCVSLLTNAIGRGAPAVALRRRGECYEAAGQRQAAINDYRRFCRIAPHHSAIRQVRPLMESWGQLCN